MKEWGADPDAALKTILVVASCLAHVAVETRVHEFVAKRVHEFVANALGRVLGAAQRSFSTGAHRAKSSSRESPRAKEVADLL